MAGAAGTAPRGGGGGTAARGAAGDDSFAGGASGESGGAGADGGEAGERPAGGGGNGGTSGGGGTSGAPEEGGAGAGGAPIGCGGLTPCPGGCVDTTTDPRHCGGCNEPCALSRATAACVSSVCRVLECDGGYEDLDGQDPNGCECRRTAEVCDGVDNDCNRLIDDVPGPAFDLCNGLDDDCDGTPDQHFTDKGDSCTVGEGICQRTGIRICAADHLGTECSVAPGTPEATEQCDDLDHDCDGVPRYSVSGGHIVSACECRDPAFAPSFVQPRCEGNCTSLTCQLGGGGQVLGANVTLGACASPFPFAECKYGSVSMNAFDADHGDDGILEIALCVTAAPGKKLNGVSFFYGNYPTRKKIAFFTDQELNAGLGGGCYKRYFLPSDFTCPVEPGLPSACTAGCVGGKWGSRNAACVFDYTSVPLWMIAEGCRSSDVTTQISNVTIRHLTGSACACLNNGDCGDLERPACGMAWPIGDPRCPPGTRCAGVCAAN